MTYFDPHYLERSCVAAPCAGTCDGIESGRRVGLCRQCGLFVYDLEGVSATAAGDLTLAMEAVPTPRFFRRKDGKYLTRNCPVGLEQLRQRLKRTAG